MQKQKNPFFASKHFIHNNISSPLFSMKPGKGNQFLIGWQRSRRAQPFHTLGTCPVSDLNTAG